MAEHLRRYGLWLVLVHAVEGHALAQALVDPTRPPAGLNTELQSGVASGEPIGPALQSILVSPKRSVAVVDGQTVKVGDKVRGAYVVKIAENEVVLRNGKDVQILKLYPNIEKQPATMHGSEESTPSGNKGKK